MSPTVAMASGIQRAGVSPSLIIYVMGRFCFAITVPSHSWSTKRHRDSVAKYLDTFVDLFDGGFSWHEKRRENKVAPSIASSLTVQGFWVAHACPKGLGETLRWAH